MGIFSRKVETAAFASAPVQAAAGASYIGNFIAYQTGTAETRALSVPTISRSRDLLAGIIGSTGLKHYSKQWNGSDYDEVYLPLEPWMEQPDPKVSRSFFFVNIFSDMFFYGVAYAYVQTRYSTGLPACLHGSPLRTFPAPSSLVFPNTSGRLTSWSSTGNPWMSATSYNFYRQSKGS